MAYAAETGATHFNELIKSGKIRAKKDGAKVIVDLDLVDEYIEGLPDATAAKLKKPAGQGGFFQKTIEREFDQC